MDHQDMMRVGGGGGGEKGREEGKEEEKKDKEKEVSCCVKEHDAALGGRRGLAIAHEAGEDAMVLRSSSAQGQGRLFLLSSRGPRSLFSPSQHVQHSCRSSTAQAAEA
eukprot:766697-Hanusia_phi.AAC.6